MMPFYNVKILHSAKPNTQAFKQANGKTIGPCTSEFQINVTSHDALF